MRRPRRPDLDARWLVPETAVRLGRQMNPVLIGIVAYVLVQLAIGVWVSRRIATEDDYLVAGRRLGPGLVAISIFATWFGAESCIGAAGQIYREGLTRTSVEPFAYGVCLLVMGLVFASPLWRKRITTLADLFRTRYSRDVEWVAAVLLIPTSLLWAAAQIRAFGQVLAATTEMEVGTAIAIAAVIAVVYTGLGGLMADVITDLVQGLALVIGLVIVLIGMLNDLGGVGAAWERIDPAQINIFGSGASFLETLEAWAIPICGSVVAQEVVSRALAARSAGVARGASVAGGLLYLIVGLIPVFIGLVGASVIEGLDDGEQILPLLAQKYLAVFPYVIFAGALVSAILSTVDSALLVAASLLSRNLILSGTTATQATRLRTARLGVLVFGSAAWLLANSASGVFDLVEQASGFGSAGVLVAVTFGIFTRFGGPRSALAALVAGIAVWIWGRYLQPDFPLPYLASLGAALLGYIAVGSFERK